MASRSRSPRPRRQGWSLQEIALRTSSKMFPGRLGEILDSLHRILYRIDDNLEIVGEAIVEEANKLKGLPRKCAQLMGDRKDLIESETIRKHLRTLQADCQKRPLDDIKRQVATLGNYEVCEIVKAGTIGEVSKVWDPASRTVYAVKTVNSESKLLFEGDFRMLQNPLMTTFLKVLKGALNTSPLPGDTLKQIAAIIDNLFNSLLNDDFRLNLMGEFNLAEEKRNLDGARVRISDGPHGIKMGVPSTVSVSDDGTVLMMEWVPGKNISDYVSSMNGQPPTFQQDIFQAVGTYYFRGLLVHGRVHRDLHPGNIIIQETLGDTVPIKVWFVDLGSELAPTMDHIPIMAKLLKHMHCEDEQNVRLHKECWQMLGVTSTKTGDEQFRCLSKSFDLIEGVAGLNLKENTEKTQFLKLPAWVLLWQTASSAVVMTLQMLQKLPGSDEGEVKKIVRDLVSHICEEVAPAPHTA